MHRSIRAVLVGLAVAALLATGAAPATAHHSTTVPEEMVPEEVVPEEVAGTQGAAAVLEALQRDLDLTRAETVQLLAAQETALAQHEQLQARLGDRYGGAWFDADTGRLTVAVTGANDARTARAAGAKATLVRHSERDLAAVQSALDAQAEQDPDTFAEAISWGVDARRSQVVLTVREGSAGAFASLAARYGETLHIEESDLAPTATSPLVGGIDYSTPSGGRSVGFNLRNPNTGVGYFVTAGHCHPAGQTASRGGVAIGPVVFSIFPFYDSALVRNDAPGDWTQRPRVRTYPGYVVVAGSVDLPSGFPVCKSGRTTQLTCGWVLQTNETVLVDDLPVYHLTRHTACVEPGDSGGSNFLPAGSNAIAAGTTTAAVLLGDRCRADVTGGFLSNISWYFPLQVLANYYQSNYGAQLRTG